MRRENSQNKMQDKKESACVLEFPNEIKNDVETGS